MRVASLRGDVGRVFFGFSSLIFVNVFFHVARKDPATAFQLDWGLNPINSWSCVVTVIQTGATMKAVLCFVDINMRFLCRPVCVPACSYHRPLISIQSACISASAAFREHCVLSNTTNPNVSSQSIVKIRSGSTALYHIFDQKLVVGIKPRPGPPYLSLSVGRRL